MASRSRNPSAEANVSHLIFMDNANAKDLAQTYFAILLNTTTDQFNQKEVEYKHEDGTIEPILINTLVDKSIKSVGGAKEDLRKAFSAKLKQYVDALVYKRKPRLVRRYREELREAHIDARQDDFGRDQAQMRGAFETFSELLRLMKIRNIPEAAQQLAEMEKMFKEMQERMGIREPIPQITTEETEESQ
jgi:hypothetical protein